MAIAAKSLIDAKQIVTWTESLPIGPSRPGDGNCDGTPP